MKLLKYAQATRKHTQEDPGSPGSASRKPKKCPLEAQEESPGRPKKPKKYAQEPREVCNMLLDTYRNAPQIRKLKL